MSIKRLCQSEFDQRRSNVNVDQSLIRVRSGATTPYISQSVPGRNEKKKGLWALSMIMTRPDDKAGPHMAAGGITGGSVVRHVLKDDAAEEVASL